MHLRRAAREDAPHLSEEVVQLVEVYALVAVHKLQAISCKRLITFCQLWRCELPSQLHRKAALTWADAIIAAGGCGANRHCRVTAAP